jgi:muramoyltetrapeptide carboxypeptidase
MNIIKPKKLQKGDTIGILAISGNIKEYERIERAKEFLENEGYKVLVSKTCKTSRRYLAGESEEELISTLHDFFMNKAVDAILCARGGFGTLKLVNKINWDIIKKNPKIFAGYSDITILLNMMLKKTGLITFHSPMANGDFSYELNEYTVNNFFETLQGKTKTYKAENPKIYCRGEAKGRIWGGNLSTLSSLCGLDFIPKDNLILFFEDLNEPEYKIDKMLTQLFNIKEIRQRVKGIAIGELKDIENETLLDEIFTDFAQQLQIPIIKGFKFTHNKTKDTIPVGTKATLNADNGELKLQEKYVK